MKKKKGVSPLIAAVLLVGFSVALAAIVSQFVIKETKKFGPEQFLEDSPFCENVVIEAVKAAGTDPVQISSAGGSGFFYLEGVGIKNKGSFSVRRLVTKSGGKEIPIILNPNVGEGKPGSVIQVDVNGVKKGLVFYPNADFKITIQPAVFDHEKEKVLPCPKQEVSVSYKELYCKLKLPADTTSSVASFSCP